MPWSSGKRSSRSLGAEVRAILEDSVAKDKAAFLKAADEVRARLSRQTSYRNSGAAARGPGSATVVGASVVVPCCVPERFSAAARAWLDTADTLLAPELLSLECANALWKKVRRHDLGEPLRIGIGLHVRPAILGEMGSGRAAALTAIGDTVNVATRLERLIKDFDGQMVTSTPPGRARRHRS
jgi:class 3 adenylate cyclase